MVNNKQKKTKEIVENLEVALEEAANKGLIEKDKVNEIKKQATTKSLKSGELNITPWDRVQMARDPLRPRADSYIEALFDDFIEMHGDRNYKDDKAIVAGIARFHGKAVTIISQQKGKDTEDNIKRQFGMPNPDGYRKVIRLAKQAEKFGRPIISFIDTPGANPGVSAEERGQAQAIAECLSVFSGLKVPIISIIIAEGGSGGALALAVCDKLIMLENSVYSILSPEGFASILWKDATKVEEATAIMGMTAKDVFNNKLCDAVITEPTDGAQEDIKPIIKSLDKKIAQYLTDLLKKTKTKLVDDRYKKYRGFGQYTK